MRALAVLAVLAFHVSEYLAERDYYHGGFLGVDLFFVLSGCLITSLLVNERTATGRISRRGFYYRRLLRLGPAMVVCCLLAAGVVVTLGPAPDSLPVGLAALLSVLSLSNVAQSVDPGSMGVLVHTWSLSLEEQFYALWPLCIGAAVLARRRISALIVVGVLIVVMYRLAVVLVEGLGPDEVPSLYFQPQARMDGLLLGSLLALALPWLRRVRPGAVRDWRIAALALGVLGLMSWTATIRATWLYLGGFTLAGLLSALVLAHVIVEQRGPLVSALEWRPLVYVGRISYGLYLYSFPVLRGVHEFLGGGNLLLLVFCQLTITFAVAALSFELVERRVLLLKDRYDPARGRSA